MCHKPNLSLTLVRAVNAKLNNNFECTNHNLDLEMVNYTIRFLLLFYTTEINKILSGKIEKHNSKDNFKNYVIKYVKKIVFNIISLHLIIIILIYTYIYII